MKDVREALMIGRNSEGKLVRRPLSPHLQAYNMMRLSSGTSIMHRITGVALGAGTLLFTAWLVCAATSESAFSVIQAIYASPIGLAVLFAFTLALFYHFCNGIRHLAWDAGKGFEITSMQRSAKVAIAASIVLTVAFWVIAFLVG